MFLTPSRSLNARIRALLGHRSFASSPDAIGPRGQGVPVLTRIRRMISSLATRTAHPFVLAQRAILLKVLEGLSSCGSSFTRETTECGLFFSLRKKLVKHFSPPLGFYPESVWCCCCCCVRVFHSERIVLRKGLSVFSPNNERARLTAFREKRRCFSLGFFSHY
jgi:hypothetical protein